MGRTHYEIIRARQDQLTAAGLCPICRKVAAPYLRCFDCRLKRSLGRQLEKLAAAGIVRRHKVAWIEGRRGRRVGSIIYSMGDTTIPTPHSRDFAQRSPRIGGKVVDTDALVHEIIGASGERGISEAEILAEIGRRRMASRRFVPT